jgi:hypothetical protein
LSSGHKNNQQFKVQTHDAPLLPENAGPDGGKKSPLKVRRREVVRFSSRRHPGRMGEQERSSVPTSPRLFIQRAIDTSVVLYYLIRFFME